MQNKSNIAVISFSDYKVPEFKEVRASGRDWIGYGQNNDYPEYLLGLFRGSSKHGSICRNKAGYVVGKGFKFKEKGDDKLLKSVNTAGESMLKVSKKCALDYEIYNGFCLSITWNKGKKIGEVYHIDFHKVRSNADNTVFFFKELGWKSYAKQDIKEYPAFNPSEPKGTQILYFKDYAPGVDTYPLPGYIQALNYIEADILVSGHTLNNADTGFTASKMINMNNGKPESVEEEKEIEKAIIKKFTGKNGSKIVLTFNNGPENAPTVLDLGASDLTKEDFQQVDNLIQQNIFSSHQVTSPMLMGIKTEGQLGGSTELRTAYEIFKNTYIDDRQDAIMEVWNTINAYRGCPEVIIIPKEPVGLDVFTNSNLFQFLPKSFVYEKIGINPDEYPELDEEQQRKEEEKKAAQQAGKFEAQDVEDLLSCFSEFGQAKENFLVLKTKKVKFSSDEDCVAYEHMAFAEMSQLESNILDLIKKDKRITSEEIAKALNKDADVISKTLSVMEEKGLLKSKTEKVGDDKQVVRETVAKPEKKPITAEIHIKYSYEGPKDEKNRDFCARMMKLDRLYSRSEIEQISQKVGYSVWERRGGFYHNPETGVTTAYCRHKWIQNIVVKK